MLKEIKMLSSYIKEYENIVFFGGAGVSTESSIPDFRSPDGLYNQKYSIPPEKILSYSFFLLNPFVFFDFYTKKMDTRDKKPNFAHTFLAYLEKEGKLKAVITQNIDGLHQKAGSKNVIELHGNIYGNYCVKCGKKYDADSIFDKKIIFCPCGYPIKPNIVLYEEALDPLVLNKARKAIECADLLIVGGTSLRVYPANTLLSSFHGKKLVIINEEETEFDKEADLVIHHKIGDTFKKLQEMD